MQKIVPHLWFDKEAKEAAEFYTSIFPESKVSKVTTLHGTPSGDADIVSFTIWGYSLMAISAGPVFKLNPSISFMINFDPSKNKDAREQLDTIWAKLSEGGTALMPLQSYPFSEYYGWIQDKYGLSWQLILTKPEGEERPPLVPSIMYVGEMAGKAEEATDYYISIFKNAKRGIIARYGVNQPPDKEGSLMFTDFMLEGQWFAAMDSAQKHQFAPNEALSLMIRCESQEEIDYFWEKLSAHKESEQCGWLKDKYGISWQVTPVAMNKMLEEGTPEQVARVTKAFLQMKKFDIATLEQAYKGE